MDLSGKRLELLKEAVPNVTRVAFLWNPANPAQGLQWKEIQAAAHELGLQLQSLEVRSSNDFDSAFEAALRERAQALITAPEPLINTHLKRIVEFAAKNRLPAMYANPEFVDAGGLMSYAPDYTAQYRRAAIYVDKILKGQASRSPCGAADEVRVHHQSENRQANRPHDSAECFSESGSSDQVVGEW